MAGIWVVGREGVHYQEFLSVPEPGTAVGAQNKPSDVITFRLRAAPTLPQHKNLIWYKLL